ncbi:MAG: helix-turn-helix transcriptional regulator [Firmicutes bacterium]|nr:helix-turn-helix transcriptional regulator [Bacillota bacterium]
MVQLFAEIREAREAYNVPRKEAGLRLGCGGRTLESYEYGRARTPLEVHRKAAEEFKSPEILDQAYEDYPQEWPRVPLPARVEASLLANAAKAVKEAKEKVESCQQMAMEMYGKKCGADLTPADQDLIEQVVADSAESVEAFKKLCLVLVKQYDYSMAGIDKIIARRLATNGQKNKAYAAR